jgi:hypothetical protein
MIVLPYKIGEALSAAKRRGPGRGMDANSSEVQDPSVSLLPYFAGEDSQSLNANGGITSNTAQTPAYTAR